MSKETYQASKCPGCGVLFAFQEQHWPHCRNNPAVLARKEPAVFVGLQAKFTKAELASIANHGAMRDQPVRKMQGVGSRKPSNAKTKGKR